MHSRKKIASVAAGVALLGGIAAAVPAAAAPSGGDAGVRSTSRAMEDVAVRRSPSAASEAIGMIPKDGIVPKTSEYNVDGEIGYVVNPELVELSEQQQDGPEGCLSLPGLGFDTSRARHAVVRGVDVDNEPVTVSGSGLMARCLQHETDHLDGYIYLDRLIGRHARAAKKMVKRNRWGVPGLDWDPAESGDPFAAD